MSKQKNDRRIARGAQIVSTGGQIHRIDETTYEVNSQTGRGVYVVIATEHGWLCSCGDSIWRGVCCKHSHAVEISRRLRKVVQTQVTIQQIDLGKCKFCESANIIKKGIKKAKKDICKCSAARTAVGGLLKILGSNVNAPPPNR